MDKCDIIICNCYNITKEDNCGSMQDVSICSLRVICLIDQIKELESVIKIHARCLSKSAQNEVKQTAALNRAVDKIHDFEGHKRTVEAIRNELIGGGK